MEIIINERPSMLPTVPALSPATTKPAVTHVARQVRPVAAGLAPRVCLMVADWQLARVHQVQIQAELVRVLVPAGGYDVAGTAGADALTSTKRMVFRGVPPRGKPV